MQTPGLDELLKIMQTPGGATLLPMVHERNNLMMDQGRASLQDTMTRTQVARDENARASQMQPYKLQEIMGQNQGRTLTNDDLAFKKQVRDKLGVDFYAKNEQDKTEKDDLGLIKQGLDNFPSLAAVIENAPAAPGARRQMAIEGLKSLRMPPAVIEAFQNAPEDQIAPTMRQIARQIAENSRQYITSSATNASRETIAAGRNLTSEKIAQIQAQVKLDVARIKAQVEAFKAGSGGKERPLNLDQLAARYFQLAEQSQSEEERAYNYAMAREVSALARDRTASSTQTAPSIVPKPGGGMTIEPRPKAPRAVEPGIPPKPSASSMFPSKENSERLPQQPKPNSPASSSTPRMSIEDYLNKFDNPKK